VTLAGGARRSEVMQHHAATCPRRMHVVKTAAPVPPQPPVKPTPPTMTPPTQATAPPQAWKSAPPPPSFTPPPPLPLPAHAAGAATPPEHGALPQQQRRERRGPGAVSSAAASASPAPPPAAAASASAAPPAAASSAAATSTSTRSPFSGGGARARPHVPGAPVLLQDGLVHLPKFLPPEQQQWLVDETFRIGHGVDGVGGGFYTQDGVGPGVSCLGHRGATCKPWSGELTCIM